MKYFFITFAFRRPRECSYSLENVVEQGESLMSILKDFLKTDDSVYIVHSVEITEQEYNKWKDEF